MRRPRNPVLSASPSGCALRALASHWPSIKLADVGGFEPPSSNLQSVVAGPYPHAQEMKPASIRDLRHRLWLPFILVDTP